MRLFNEIRLAAAIAWRDMRGGARALGLLVAGVFVGAAAVALVGTASTALIDAARKGGLEAVGGDISLRLFHHPPSDDQLAHIRQFGDVSVTAELRPMVRGLRALDASRSAPLLVELKGVDMAYPLYGDVRTEPNFPLYQSLNQHGGVYGAVADQALFDQLGLELGDSLLIGEGEYQLRAVLTNEPDRAFRAFTLGPRVMVLTESFPAADIAKVGEEVYHYTRLKLAGAEGAGRDADAAARALNAIDEAFPNAGWRMVNAHEGVPGVERTLAMAHVLLLFIGLGVLLIGGAGIAGAVRAHVNAKTDVIAILKSIGTPPRVITLALFVEVMAAAGLGAVLGLGLGAFGPALAANALMGQLPFQLDAFPAVQPMVGAGLFGVLVAALFAWWPLMGVHDLSARVLLRERLEDRVSVRGRPGAWLGVAAIVFAIVGLVMWVSPMPALTIAFLVGALMLAVLYFALGHALAKLARVAARGRSATLRLGLANLHRAGAPTGPVVMALGLTLTLLVALNGLGEAATAHIQRTVPSQAPDLVAFSLPGETARTLEEDLLARNVAKSVRAMPFLHARIQAIKGVPVRDLKIPRSLAWVVRGDRGVSFSAEMPEGGRIVEGAWWTTMEAEGVAFSFDASVADRLGLHLGDEITLNVMGRSITGPIKNLRAIDWTGLDLDFPVIATPGALQSLPHTYAAALTGWPDGGADMEDFVRRHYPEVPLIRVDDVLGALAKALDAVIGALVVAALMCGIAALVVLAGSVLQGLVQRIDEAVLFKVLGARRGQLMGVLALEFCVLGGLVALAAVPLGLLVSFAVSKAAGVVQVALNLGGALALAAVAVGVTVVVGLLVTLSAYTVTPARVLRNRGL